MVFHGGAPYARYILRDMADIEFQEEQSYERPIPEHGRSWLANIVIRAGFARDSSGAQKILLAILGLIIAAIVLIFVFTSTGGGKPANHYRTGQNILTAPATGQY